MKNNSLSKRWLRWRQQRYRALTAQDFASDLAWKFAAVEARYRQRIGRIIGHDRAEEAELAFTGTSFALLGSLEGLTITEIEAAEEVGCWTLPQAA